MGTRATALACAAAEYCEGVSRSVQIETNRRGARCERDPFRPRVVCACVRSSEEEDGEHEARRAGAGRRRRPPAGGAQPHLGRVPVARELRALLPRRPRVRPHPPPGLLRLRRRMVRPEL